MSDFYGAFKTRPRLGGRHICPPPRVRRLLGVILAVAGRAIGPFRQ